MKGKFITLTTDYGNSSFYIGILKGVLYSNIENVEIIDITHDIPLYNIYIAAFIFKNSYEYFPKGTIHILDVYGEHSVNNNYLLLKHKGYYFLCADNGLASLIFDDGIDEIYKINTTQEQIDSNFKTKDILLKIAIKIANNQNIDKNVTKIKEFTIALNKINPPTINDNKSLVGSVVYIDNNYNAIINITKEKFLEFTKNKNFNISFNSISSTTKISKNYIDNEANQYADIKILFGSTHNLMEIAIPNTNAAPLLGLKIGSTILINLLD
ncbi:MAG: SAM hydrolase/SAM-dependent halogenase family protein [Bacteroidales bacterium]